MRKKISLIILLVIVIMSTVFTGSIYALSFTVGINLNTKVATKGGNVEVTISIDNVNVGGEGMNVFMTTINYDRAVFEEILPEDITGLNGWTYTFNKENGKIFLENSKFVTTDSDLFKVVLHIKEEINVETTDIKLVDPQTSNYRMDIVGTTAVTTLGIKKLTSDVYDITEDNKIKGIVADTTVEQFKNNLNYGGNIVVKNKNGQELTGNEKLGTGTVISTSNGEEYTLIVKGDINGDGIVDIGDIAQLVAHIAKIKSLENEAYLAGDIVGNDGIDISDIARIVLYMAKMITIEQL